MYGPSRKSLGLWQGGLNTASVNDFGKTFPLTVSSSCAHLLSTIACELDLDVCHFDLD